MLKKIFAFFIVVTCLLLVLVFFITRNTPASHPVLQESNLPPLIPTRAFYADPREAFGYRPSNDGKYVSLQKASIWGRNIVVQDVATGEEIAEFPIGLSHIRWHPSKPLLRFIFEGHDWEADPFNSEREKWVRTSPIKLSGGWSKSQIVSNENDRILTWGKTNARWPAHMWLVSQDGLEAEKVAKGNQKTNYWVFNGENEPVLRVDSLDPATVRMFTKVADDWEKLIDIDLNDAFSPVSNVRSDGTVLVRSARGRDKAALVSLDVRTGVETVVIENPDADIALTTSLTNEPTPDIIRLGFHTQESVALTDRGQTFLDILAEFPQPITLGFTAPTASGRYVAQAVSTQSKSYIYLLIDLEEKSYITLGEFHFRRFKDHLVQEQAVTFEARDGLEVPAVLTMPNDVAGPIPFIVYIHGGPASNVQMGYGHGTQFLVNRGYGVLSVNFRGSDGFGKTFQAKGFKEFGRAMQDDIADAAQWLVDEGLADTNALVAMGTSYGGYSAALAMTRDAGLFDAAIVEFPMLDVEFQSKYHPGFWESGINSWWRYFGKPENPDDLELMRKYSPSNRIEDIHGPIMVLAGSRDNITAVQQVKDFEEAVLKTDKDVAFHYFPNAGHGVRHWRDELRRARLLEDFLAEQVGGRSGGFEFAERAPAFID